MNSLQSISSGGSTPAYTRDFDTRRELTARYLSGELDYEAYRRLLPRETRPLRDWLVLGGLVGLGLWLLGRAR